MRKNRRRRLRRLTDELLEWRREFPILESAVYLIPHSLGAMPRRTYERLQEYAEMWATRGVRAWAEGWWEMPQTVGDEVGRIIGAEAGTVVMHQNVSVCQSLILSCFDTTPETGRNKIVYSELEFLSVMYVYHAHAPAGRLRIHKVKSDDGIAAPLEATRAAIDEETLLVPVSHVLFKSASLQDARAIIERAHEVGALVVLDTYQSSTRGRRARRARHIPVGRHRAFQRERFGRGLLHGRLGQVALRRAPRGLPLRAAAAPWGARAEGHGLDGSRRALRVRGVNQLRRRGRAFPPRLARRPRAL